MRLAIKFATFTSSLPENFAGHMFNVNFEKIYNTSNTQTYQCILAYHNASETDILFRVEATQDTNVPILTASSPLARIVIMKNRILQ